MVVIETFARIVIQASTTSSYAASPNIEPLTKKYYFLLIKNYSLDVINDVISHLQIELFYYDAVL
ncbi:MAG TPA: hypothetical protein VKA87_02030 [Nitrososphaeraceae archaeon]|nr:hypothetical protein [Nitrososphaeraceae archaeon]